MYEVGIVHHSSRVNSILHFPIHGVFIELIANRFGGRLHIDSGESSQPLESIALVNKGNFRTGIFLHKR